MIKINIDLCDEISDFLLEYLAQYTNELDLYDICENEENGKDDLKLIASFGDYEFKHKEINFKVSYFEEGDILPCPNGPDKRKKLILYCNHHSLNEENIKEVKKFILDIKKSNRPKLENNIRIYIPNKVTWNVLNTIQKRPLDTIFIHDIDKILNDVETFINDESIYITKGIKYKRNYLLHGPPGTGKTSLISAIASKYSLDIFMINLNAFESDNAFVKLINILPERSILVLEDIDHLFKNENSKKISFSTILNTLDGFACKNRLMTFMTTNNFNHLDETIKRPGRIDYIMEFKYANKKQMKDMYTSYLENRQNFEELYEKIKMKKISTAAFNKFLFDNRKDKNILSKLDVLDNLSVQYKTYQNMFI